MVPLSLYFLVLSICLLSLVDGKLTTCQVQTNYQAFRQFIPGRIAVTEKQAQSFPDLSNDTVRSGNATNATLVSREATSLVGQLHKELQSTSGGAQKRKRRSVTYTYAAGSLDHNGLVNVCGYRSVCTDLGPDIYPRYINEIVCDDTYCMMGQGQCAQNVMYLRFKRKTSDDHTLNNLEDWFEYDQAVRVSCCCKLFEDGLFTVFVK